MSGRKQGVLSQTIKNQQILYSSYMPFINNGGLFIPTTREYKMGEEVLLLLSLMDEQERLPIAGTVVWITPMHAHENRKMGIGVQFNTGDNGLIKTKIEEKLTGILDSSQSTQTM